MSPGYRISLVAILVAAAQLTFCCSAGAQAADPLGPISSIFTPDNVEALCLTTEPRVVSRYALAEMIVHAVNVPLDLLKTANPDGRPIAVAADSPIPPANYIHYVSSDTPFGDNPSLYSKEMKVAYDQQRLARAFLQTWLDLNAEKKKPIFKVVSTRPGPVYVQDLFAENSPVQIVCVTDEKKPGPPGQQHTSAQQQMPARDWSANLIVRKSVTDIVIPANKIAKANAAIFSYSENNVDDSKSYTIDGLIGITIAGTGADRAERAAVANQSGDYLPHYWFKLTPYLYGKRYNRTPDSATNQDIDFVQPGLVGSLTWVSANGGFAFDLQGDGSHTQDIAQDASFYNSSLLFSPSFQIGHTTLFNAPLFLGPIGLRPNVGLALREYYIEDAGTSPQLQSKTSFTSYGVDAELKMFLITKMKYLSALEGRVRYLYLENTNGVVTVPRFEAGLSASPPGLQNVTLDLEYVDGRDQTTLQE
jgi:hypothetical protein